MSRENITGNEYMIVSIHARNATNCKLKHLCMFALIIIVYNILLAGNIKVFLSFLFPLSLFSLVICSKRENFKIRHNKGFNQQNYKLYISKSLYFFLFQ